MLDKINVDKVMLNNFIRQKICPNLVDWVVPTVRQVENTKLFLGFFIFVTYFVLRIFLFGIDS